MNAEFTRQLLAKEMDSSIIDQLFSGNSITEKQMRFSVYRNNVQHSLIEALIDIFPVTHQVVGQDFFYAMAHEYIQKEPPTSKVLTEYGDGFAAFIAQFSPAQHLTYLSELASLEKMLLTLTHDIDYPVMSPPEAKDALERCTGDGAIYLKLLPNTQILKSEHAVGTIWLAHQQEKVEILEDIDLRQTEYLLLYKAHLKAELKLISLPQAHFIKALLQGESIDNAIDKTGGSHLENILLELSNTPIISKIEEDQQHG